MPASIGIRARPAFGLVRRGNLRRIHDHRVQMGKSLTHIPLMMLAPLVIIAGLTAGFALNWTHTIHTEEMASSGNAPETTGTITIRN